MYAETLPAATITVCRLHAARDELRRRIMTPGQGGSWAQPGDPLNGLPTPRLHAIADLAAEQADVLDRAAIGDVRIDTAERSVDEIADAILERTEWPNGAVGRR